MHRVLRERAERVDLRMPARVRPHGHATWRDADIVNVSRTGILLAVSSALPPADTIDVEFAAAPELPSVPDVRCIGHVVRETLDPGGRVMLAAAFEEHPLTRFASW
jgi:hypothetical protein